jgi:hypothetical protein
VLTADTELLRTVRTKELLTALMRDDVSRRVGIDGMVVTGVVEVGRPLEIEVKLVTEVACCRWCGRASLTVKDRPVLQSSGTTDRRTGAMGLAWRRWSRLSIAIASQGRSV